MALKTSINIKYDINNKQLLDDYFATNSHNEIIKGILLSTLDNNSARAHIAYGPYGSGKSFVSTIITNLIAKKYTKKALRNISDKYKLIDEKLPKLIKKSQEQELEYIPIVINGYKGSFEKTIINTIQGELNKKHIYIATPGIFNDIDKIISRWKNGYSEAFDSFLDLLDKRGYSFKEFSLMVRNRDEKAVEVFTGIYESITFGSKLNSIYNSRLIEYLEYVLFELNKRKIGLFIVYDEFGRVLQNVESDNLNQFMSLMQDIAELASSGSKNLITLFVTHKPISYYFALESREKRSEFAKVEKRFSVYEIKSDYTTFLKITQDFLQYLDNVHINDEVLYNMRKFNVFSNELSDVEVENIVLTSLYPLHPITLFLLPNISRVFGQNERTLFTFLKDDSSTGFTGFTTNNKGYYFPDKLADYFFDNIDKSYVDDVKTYQIYRKNINDINSFVEKKYSANALRIYKFIMLWKISNNNSDVQLTNKFISFSLGISQKVVIQLLERLSQVKKIRYNVIISEWELFEGSPVNIDLEIQKRQATIVASENDIVEYISKQNPYRFIYSRGFNAEYEMTRFAIVDFLTKDMIINYNESMVNCDQWIPIYINELPQTISSMVYGILNYKVSDLFESVKKLMVLNNMLNDSMYVNDNPNIDKEIDYEITLIEIELEEFYKKMFSSDTTYFIKNKEVSVKSISGLEKKLSKLFTLKYKETLHIVNDQINMFILTKIQTNALVSVLDKVIKLSEENLEKYFIGSKPADLVYYTIVKDINDINGNKNKLISMKNNLYEHINNNPNGFLFNLVEILQKEPFGLRPQISILITFMLIKDLWKDIMLFSNDSFIPTIGTEELFSALLNDHRRIRYSFNIFDNKNRESLERLEEVFNDIPLEVINKSLSIRVCAGMYRWYLNLPIITQQLDGLDYSNIDFLKIISSSRINPRKAIFDLLKGDYIADIDLFVSAIEQNLSNKLMRVESQILNKLNETSLKFWALKQDVLSKKNNKFVKLCIESETPLEDYSIFVENVSIDRWTKSSFEKMEAMIFEDIGALSNDVDFSSIIINGKEKLVQSVSLSRKSLTALDNIVNTIDATRRYYSDVELEQLIIELVKRYVN